MISIDILVCTINDGIAKVPDMLMPPKAGVRYVVCMQYTDEKYLDSVPMRMLMRPDVKYYVHESRGLCRNRNFALDWAEADVCVIADDDNRYKPEYIDAIRQAYEAHPDADIITFQAETLDGEPLHRYPAEWVCSVEMTFRTESIRRAGLRFNEDFGIAGNRYCAGEEDIFMKDARDRALRTYYEPRVIVRTPGITTSSGFERTPLLQVTKGAVFCYVFGYSSALWRTFKEAAWWMLHRRCNPMPIFVNMIKGIRDQKRQVAASDVQVPGSCK